MNGIHASPVPDLASCFCPISRSGACPAGSMPIYSVWNNRADSNHRHLATRALRDQLAGLRYIAGRGLAQLPAAVRSARSDIRRPRLRSFPARHLA